MKYYSSDEPAWRFLGEECQSQCLTETWSVESKSEAKYQTTIGKKQILNLFLALA